MSKKRYLPVESRVVVYVPENRRVPALDRRLRYQERTLKSRHRKKGFKQIDVIAFIVIGYRNTKAGREMLLKEFFEGLPRWQKPAEYFRLVRNQES